MDHQVTNIKISAIEKPALLRKLPTYRRKIAISIDKGLVIIPTVDILYCQAQSSYCNIVLKSGKQYLISKTLKRVQSILNPANFIKVHQSYIVSIDSIHMLDEGLTLFDDTKMPIARSKRKAVQEQLARHCHLV